MRLVPRRWRFRAARLLAAALKPLVQLTPAYRHQRMTKVDGADEIALYFVTRVLTKHGSRYDPVVAIDGFDRLVHALDRGKGALLLGPHVALFHLLYRQLYDHGIEGTGLNADPQMRFDGTLVRAPTLQPSPTFFVAIRNVFRRGGLVCGTPDRAEHHEGRTIQFDTANGPIIVAPALVEVATRCSAQVLFLEVHSERSGVRATIRSATTDSSAGILAEFADFVRWHIESHVTARRAPSWSIKRLLFAAALVHVGLAGTLLTIGRARVAPAVVDQQGLVGVSGGDSRTYLRGAEQLTGAATAVTPGEEPDEHNRMQMRLVAFSLAAFGHVTGDNVLAAEPINLLCFLAIVALVYAIGREIGGNRAALWAATMVALWPTLLLHTTQFLKEPLFIAAGLMLLFVVTTWLTREYRARDAVVVAMGGAVAATLLLAVRPKFAVIIVVVTLLALTLLLVRQVRERRLLLWNFSCAGAIFTAGALTLLHANRTIEKIKADPSVQSGLLKKLDGPGVAKQTTIMWRAEPTPTGADRAIDRAARALGAVRHRYNTVNAGAGSAVDDTVEFSTPTDLVRYAPRAAQIGLWAPFPNTWLVAGTVGGRAPRMLAGGETLVIYICELLALIGIARGPRRLAALFLLGVGLFGVTTLGLVVSNVGTLYRFRYSFWILFVILGMHWLARETHRHPMRSRAS